MPRRLQFVILATASVATTVATAIPVLVLSGITHAEEPASAILGAAIVGIPLLVGVAALAGSLWQIPRLHRKQIVAGGIVLNGALLVALVVVLAKAWRGGLHGFAALYLAVAVVSAALIAALVAPLHE